MLVLFINWLLPSWQIQHGLLKTLAIILVAIGLGIELYSVALFVKARTTVNPLKPDKAKTLVISGMYRVTRNPMYLGMLILLVGLVVWIGNVAAIPVLALFVWFITRFQIKPEEQALRGIFGQAFIDYENRVRRWI